MNNTQFMYAVVGFLARRGWESLDSGDVKLHKAMAAAINIVGKQELVANGVRLCLDPITQTVGDVFHLASLLQSNQMARRPNPTFTPLKLKFGDAGFIELTQDLKDSEIKLAKRFADIVATNMPDHKS